MDWTDADKANVIAAVTASDARITVVASWHATLVFDLEKACYEQAIMAVPCLRGSRTPVAEFAYVQSSDSDMAITEIDLRDLFSSTEPGK